MAAIPAVRIIRHASTPGTPVTGRALLTPQSSMSSASGHGRDLRSPELGSTRSLSTNSNPFTESPRLQRGMTSKFTLHPNPLMWGYDVSPKSIEEDDWLHKPDEKIDDTGSIWNMRGFTTLGSLGLLLLALVGLFLGYPVISALLWRHLGFNGGFNLGGINSTGQVMETAFSLIDKATPEDARTKASPVDGRTMMLVFSDEFETEGRSFYPGDDPFWEAADLYYWGTNDLEWYDPEAVTTKGGKLVLNFKAEPNHDLQYKGGMITSWNKLCFTGGMIEASVQLPGRADESGFWPAIWTMGNLGRAGYGATTDGMWPYSYDTCDVGTLPNQTLNGLPNSQLGRFGDQAYQYSLSYLPGQRLSACTCAGEEHPGPRFTDGTFPGRSAPEIDIFEAQTRGNTRRGAVSQSSQFAPFNAYFSWDNATYLDLYTPATQELNGFKGNVYQQATSVVSDTDQNCYEKSPQPCFAVYGFQYKPGYEGDKAHITWINDDKLSWQLRAGGVGRDDVAQIGERLIPAEPMYMILNLGMSPQFAPVDPDIGLPAKMSVDYVRIYQYEDEINVGCDPPNFPTSNYINRFIEAYTNPNLTTWTRPPEAAGYNQVFPKNRLIDDC